MGVLFPCNCWKIVLKLVACHDPTLPIPAANTCQTAGSTAVLEVARLTELMCRFAFGEQIPIDPQSLGDGWFNIDQIMKAKQIKNVEHN